MNKLFVLRSVSLTVEKKKTITANQKEEEYRLQNLNRFYHRDHFILWINKFITIDRFSLTWHSLFFLLFQFKYFYQCRVDNRLNSLCCLIKYRKVFLMNLGSVVHVQLYQLLINDVIISLVTAISISRVVERIILMNPKFYD